MFVTNLSKNSLQRVLKVTAQPFPNARVQNFFRFIARPRPGPYFEKGKVGPRGFSREVRKMGVMGVVYVNGLWSLAFVPIFISFRLCEIIVVVQRDFFVGFQLFLGL